MQEEEKDNRRADDLLRLRSWIRIRMHKRYHLAGATPRVVFGGLGTSNGRAPNKTVEPDFGFVDRLRLGADPVPAIQHELDLQDWTAKLPPFARRVVELFREGHGIYSAACVLQRGHNVVSATLAQIRKQIPRPLVTAPVKGGAA